MPDWLRLSGRTRRLPYLYWTLLSMLLSWGVHPLLRAGVRQAGGELLALRLLDLAVSVVLGWIGLAFMVRRLHDLGRSGWWALFLPLLVLCCSVVAAVAAVVLAVPRVQPRVVVGGVVVVAVLGALGFQLWLLCAPGTPGANRFDRAPSRRG